MRAKDSISKLEEIIALPNREDAYYQLVSLFFDGPEEIREKIRHGWDFGVEWVYPNIRRLACCHNEKRLSSERIFASLAYDAIEDLQQEDPNEKLVAIAVIYHSCIAAGLDPEEVFKKVASISSQRMASFFLDFINRIPEDKSKEAFMLSSIKNTEGETEIFPSWMK